MVFSTGTNLSSGVLGSRLFNNYSNDSNYSFLLQEINICNFANDTNPFFSGSSLQIGCISTFLPLSWALSHFCPDYILGLGVLAHFRFIFQTVLIFHK